MAPSTLNPTLLPWTADQPPCVLVCRADLTNDLWLIDKQIVANILDEVAAGRINKRNPALRQQLIPFVATYAFTPDAYKAFSLLIANAPGRKKASVVFCVSHHGYSRPPPLS